MYQALFLCLCTKAAWPPVQVEITGHKELGRGGCGQVVLALHACRATSRSRASRRTQTRCQRCSRCWTASAPCSLGLATTLTLFRCADTIS